MVVSKRKRKVAGTKAADVNRLEKAAYCNADSRLGVCNVETVALKLAETEVENMNDVEIEVSMVVENVNNAEIVVWIAAQHTADSMWVEDASSAATVALTMADSRIW